MQNHGDKLLLGFLGFSLLIYLLSIVYRDDSAAGLRKDPSNTDTDTSIANASVDTKVELQNNPSDNIKSHPSSSVDPKVELDRKISLESYALKVAETRWKLPNRLQEISGLAMTMDNRLLAHNDEKGVIYEIDFRNGVIVKAFQLADIAKPVADDFEGIATVNDRVYLVTSSGRIYECSEGTDGESVLFNIYATGVGRDCEIEGLAYDASQRTLLLMCKNARSAALEEQLPLYHWSIEKKQLKEDVHTVIPVIEFSRHIKGKKFQPSGIERHPVSGNYFIVAAGQEAIAEITPEGQVVAVKQFPNDWHRQTEGITFAADGTLIIADEGAGKKARLTLYSVSESQQ